jgi:hypothetical protein
MRRTKIIATLGPAIDSAENCVSWSRRARTSFESIPRTAIGKPALDGFSGFETPSRPTKSRSAFC